MPSAPRPGYQTLRVGLRAPRVALVIDGGTGWESSAALALYTAGRTWGGAGFAAIPHHNGVVPPALLRLARFYDPDYVLALQYTPREFEAIHPGRLSVRVDGERLTGRAMLERLGDQADRIGNWPSESAEQARTAIMAACSPYREQLDGGVDRWAEPVHTIHHSQIAGDLTPSEALGDDHLWLALPPDLGGQIGLAAAIRCGFADLPELPFESTQALGDTDRASLVRYCIGNRPTTWPPPQMLSRIAGVEGANPAAEAPPAWEQSRAGLSFVAPLRPERPSALIVLGSSSDDFALALAWDRMFGNGVWVPDSWLADGAPERSPALTALRMRVQDATFPAGYQVLVTSLSMSEDVVADHLTSFAYIDQPYAEAGDSAELRYRGAIANAVAYRPPLEVPLRHAGHLACEDQFDHPFSLPSETDPDSVMLAVPAPDLSPAAESLRTVDDLDWQVDVEFIGSAMPTGRGLTGHALHADERNRWSTWVRSGRDGISYSSRSWGFVPAGASRRQRVARPRLRHLGPKRWVEEMLAAQNMQVRLSPAGKRAEILRRMWGSRSRLASDLGEKLRPLFSEFIASRRASAEAYPNGDAVVLNPSRREGYLTFDAAKRVLQDAMDESDIREELDRLLTIGALRRGLVLDCVECGTVAFTRIDILHQVNTCARCGASSSLSHERWRQPPDEPRWYYDLHPVTRDLLAEHGDVPLLVAHHFQQDIPSFADTPELEIYVGGQRRSEIDIIAVADDSVIVGEAKYRATLGSNRDRNRTIRKLVDLTRRLRGDQIALCTTEAQSWPDAELTQLRNTITDQTWPIGEMPTIRVITGLASDQLTDVAHEY